MITLFVNKEKLLSMTVLFTIMLSITLIPAGSAVGILGHPAEGSVEGLPAEPVPVQKSGSDAAVAPLAVVWEMLGQVNLGRALNDLRQLTGEEPVCTSHGCYTINHRLTGSQGLDWAQEFLYEQLGELGYAVEAQDWSGGGYSDQNIIARKEGVLRPAEKVIFIAHIDGARTYDASFPAADDNASGAVNGLELARILSQYQFERTLVLFFSSGEEQSALGVKSYLAGLSPEALSEIRYVVNRDMTGYDRNQDRVMELFHGDHPPSIALAQLIRDVIEAYDLDLVPLVVKGCP